MRLKIQCVLALTAILATPVFAAPKWQKIDGSKGAQQFFVDANSIRTDAENKGLKNFTGMFNLILDGEDVQQIRGSIIGQFTLDCEQRKLRTNATKAYDQLDGKGELLEEDPAGDPEFFPLNDQIRARAMYAAVCR